MGYYANRPNVFEAVQWDGTNLEELQQLAGIQGGTASANGDGTARFTLPWAVLTVPNGSFVFQSSVLSATDFASCFQQAPNGTAAYDMT